MDDEEEILAENVPVTLPELPLTLRIASAQQFKALGDSVRHRILAVIQHQPATAKQIASRLNIAPGTIGHHLQVLEAAGLIQVVARRLIRGIVAKYYTRTARIFMMDFPPEIDSGHTITHSVTDDVRNDIIETLAASDERSVIYSGYPRVHISEERVQHYEDRLKELMYEFLSEPFDPHGQAYNLFAILFKAPPSQQIRRETQSTDISTDAET